MAFQCSSGIKEETFLVFTLELKVFRLFHNVLASFYPEQQFFNQISSLFYFILRSVCLKRCLLPESRKRFSNVYNRGFWWKFQYLANFPHGFAVEICHKYVSWNFVDTSEDLLSCCINNIRELDVVTSTGLPAREVESFAGYARLLICGLAMVFFRCRASYQLLLSFATSYCDSHQLDQCVLGQFSIGKPKHILGVLWPWGCAKDF